ncbi:MAG: DNA polymerase III subunit delta [Saprospiraceae bacterium]
MTFEQIIESIKKGNYSPLYLFHGEESFFIDQLVNEIQENLLTDMEKEFNQNIFYGKDADPKNIVATCMQYPMMSEHRVVILKEAQSLKNIDNLLPLVQNPPESTIFVVAYKDGKLNMNMKLGRAFKANGTVFLSDKIYESNIPKWIANYSKSLGISITTNATILMTNLLSNDLSKIDNELQKLKILYGKETTIDIEHIKSNTSLNREYSMFELGKALSLRDFNTVYSVLNIFKSNPTAYPNVLIINNVFNQFVKTLILSENKRLSDNELSRLLGVNPFFLKDFKIAAKAYSRTQLINIISIIAEYDLKSKGIDNKSNSQVDLLVEMSIKIMN